LTNTNPETPGVVIVGGGPAGLAVAACVRRRDIDSVVLDAGSSVGESWRNRYERLHLHTPRLQSGMPGYPIPRRFGRWVGKDDVATYLTEYATHHGIEPEHNVTVDRIDIKDGAFLVSTNKGPRQTANVVMATGYMRVPSMPLWPGLDSYQGEVVHAATYRSDEPFRDKRVLVVGTGNTGAEIATDLAEQGAAHVWLAYRTPPHVLTRQIGPFAATALGFPNQYLPARLCDPVNRVLEQVTVGDLSAYGLPRPRTGLKAQLLATEVVPIIDVGLIAQLKAGRVEPVPAVESFTETSVTLADDRSIEPDAVIVATGYRRGLESIVGHLGVLNDAGAPIAHGPKTHPRAPGLYFIGMLPTLKGLLFQINRDARMISRRIARQPLRQPATRV
jgi:putative flavoprotein involved in K+ transport